jgi:hypothetical protein
MEDIFGNTDPQKMPIHFFWGAIQIDYHTASKANTDKQNYSVCPRHWYVDAHFICQECRRNFIWTASEQKKWFEDYFFWVDSHPKKCRDCRKKERTLNTLRLEYDRNIKIAKSSKNIEVKKKILRLIEEMNKMINIPAHIAETQRIFEKQINRAEHRVPLYRE